MTPTGTAPLHISVTASDGVVVDVWRTGSTSGPAVILCHGFVQNRFAFQSERRSLPAHLCALGYTVYVVELRGRHGSNRASGLVDYIEKDAEAVIEHVAHVHASVAWIGHSMGGIVGSLLRPEVASRLASITAIGAPLFPGRPELHFGAKSTLVAAARLVHRRGIAFRGRSWSAGLYAARAFLDQPRVPAPVRIWAPGSLDDSELAFALKQSFSDDSWGAFADLMELVVTNGSRAGRVDARGRLASMTRPLLPIAGDADDLAPPSAARPLFDRSGSTHKEYLEVGKHVGARMGHIDLLIGEAAPSLVWAPVTSFIRRHTRP